MVSKINPNPFTTRPEIEGTFGVVTSTHWIATAVGMATLEKGGNAFDAACATAFTLQVVEPHLNGPGGDVPVIINDVRTGKTEVICGQGPFPAAASAERLRDMGLALLTRERDPEIAAMRPVVESALTVAARWRSICEPRWRSYCERWGYDLICIEEPLDSPERARRRSRRKKPPVVKIAAGRSRARI